MIVFLEDIMSGGRRERKMREERVLWLWRG
jgi:hypothetical protein